MYEPLPKLASWYFPALRFNNQMRNEIYWVFQIFKKNEFLINTSLTTNERDSDISTFKNISYHKYLDHLQIIHALISKYRRATFT